MPFKGLGGRRTRLRILNEMKNPTSLALLNFYPQIHD